MVAHPDMIANAAHEMPRTGDDNATHASLPMAPTKICTTSLAALLENMENVLRKMLEVKVLGGEII